jgi:PAS domain S-box-containing protein
VDPFVLLLQLAFYVTFAVSLWRWVTRRGPLELAVALVFAPIAALFLLSSINSIAPGIAPVVRPATIFLILLQPWFVVRLVDQIRPVAAQISWAVLAGCLIGALAILLVPGVRAISLAVVIFFFAVQFAAAIRLVADSRRRTGVARVRLTTAAIATGLFGFAILVSGVASAAAPAGAPGNPSVQVATRLISLAAGLGYLFAFVPPAWLRRQAYRVMAFDLMRNLIAPEAHDGAGRLWSDLAASAREILGARRVSILSGPEGLPLATVGEAGEPTDPVQPGGARIVVLDRGTAAAADRGTDVAADRGAAPAEYRESTPPAAAPTLGARLRELFWTRTAIVSKISVPIRSGNPAHEQLIAEIEGRALFVEDDVALISMLGSLTARTVDREEALITLGQARSAIEESAMIKASESRFRALLDADPNAVLALDEHERVVWATRQAGELFGGDTQSIAGMAIGDLVAMPHDVRPQTTGERPVYRADTTGRRLDGTHFPAEIARTPLELEGQTLELAVVSDVSWRHEAAQIRDRFLGVLSHELRTPVTSIYGGTQLLLGRGARLDEETRTELLVSVAAESERLQRMVENLIALARIERGAEFAPSRPVLIDRVIRDLIDRERQLWPEVTIRLDIPHPVQMVSAEEEYIGQVVRNLLSNAAKYSGLGSTIEVEVTDGDGEVLIYVRDDGPGIDQDDADKLFSLYYRSAHQAASAPGAGIGLFICKELVALMGGRIWARSREPKGAEFGFTLPAYVEEPDPSFEPSELPLGEMAFAGGSAGDGLGSAEGSEQASVAQNGRGAKPRNGSTNGNGSGTAGNGSGNGSHPEPQAPAPYVRVS